MIEKKKWKPVFENQHLFKDSARLSFAQSDAPTSIFRPLPLSNISKEFHFLSFDEMVLLSFGYVDPKHQRWMGCISQSKSAFLSSSIYDFPDRVEIQFGHAQFTNTELKFLRDLNKLLSEEEK